MSKYSHTQVLNSTVFHNLLQQISNFFPQAVPTFVIFHHFAYFPEPHYLNYLVLSGWLFYQTKVITIPVNSNKTPISVSLKKRCERNPQKKHSILKLDILHFS